MAKIKGVCKNIGDECSKALNREVQDVEKSAPFVCEECEKPLMAVNGGGGGTPGTGGGPMKIIILVVILAVLGGGGYYAYTMFSGDEQKESPEVVLTPIDEPAVIPTPEPETSGEETPSDEAAPYVVIDEGDAATGTGKGTVSYHYGKYTGEIKNNKANGQGSLKFYKAYRLSQFDKQERMAENGDVISGTFKDDNLTNGKWFDKDNTQKGAVLTGELGIPE